MIECPACHQGSDWVDFRCPCCHFQLPLVGGFPSLIARDPPEGGFSADFFRQIAPMEARHFWFIERNTLILEALARHGKAISDFMEIGCGTGFVLDAIHQAYPDWHLLGTELFSEGLEVAAERIQGVPLIQMDARQSPFRAHFDAIGLFDVLEHIKEDDQVLRMIERALRPRGLLLLTVPQHPWLWSHTDEMAFHVRRYRRKDLERQLKAAGFSILETTSFMSLLLPLMLLSRVFSRRSDDPHAELRLSPRLNGFLGRVLAVERLLRQQRLKLPFGGSLLIVAARSAP